MVFGSRRPFVFVVLVFALRLILLANSGPVEQSWLAECKEESRQLHQYVHLFQCQDVQVTKADTISRCTLRHPTPGRALMLNFASLDLAQSVRIRDLRRWALCTACRLFLTNWTPLRRVSTPKHHTPAIRERRSNFEKSVRI